MSGYSNLLNRIQPLPDNKKMRVAFNEHATLIRVIIVGAYIFLGSFEFFFMQEPFQESPQSVATFRVVIVFFVCSIIASYLASSYIRSNVEVKTMPACVGDTNTLAPAIKGCNSCGRWKPVRSHHCSICNQCTLKMDHHCPWVVNCVGARNHKAFLLFCAYACLGHAFFIIQSLFNIYSMYLHYKGEPNTLDMRKSAWMLIVMVPANIVGMVFLFATLALSLGHGAMGCDETTTIQPHPGYHMRTPCLPDFLRTKSYKNPFSKGHIKSFWNFMGTSHLKFFFPFPTELKYDAYEFETLPHDGLEMRMWVYDADGPEELHPADEEFEERKEMFSHLGKQGNELFINTKLKYFDEWFDVKELLHCESLLKEENAMLASQEPENIEDKYN